MALWQHFGSSDIGDQQVAHGNQNTHTPCPRPRWRKKELVQVELAGFFGYGGRSTRQENKENHLSKVSRRIRGAFHRKVRVHFVVEVIGKLGHGHDEKRELVF